MAILRTEFVNYAGDDKNRFDCLVDSTTDLSDLSYCGVGSLAYVRDQAEGSRVYVKTGSGWEAIASGGDEE